MGIAIVKILANKNHRLLLFSDETNELDDLLSQIKKDLPDLEIESMGCPKEASWEADIIILTISPDEEKDFAEKIRDFATGKVIISMSNLSNNHKTKARKSFIPGPPVDLKEMLPNSKIIKAFEGPIMNAEILESIIDQH